MFIIDYPYVSEFLVKTIKENNFPVVDTGQARQLIPDNAINWISVEEARSLVAEKADLKIYTNSENSIELINRELDSSVLSNRINVFKDKFLFRQLVRDLFPKYYFRKVKIEELAHLNIVDIPFPIVIKPTVGFFSLAVHIVQNEREWNKAVNKINSTNLKHIYPEEVLDASNFIIEEYIEGEEFAIDCYFNDAGEAVILNILQHYFSSENDASDRVYASSKEIIEKHLTAFEAFIQVIGKKADLVNFPAHIELRIDANGKIQPIEINPLRFGGWCTTGDLSWNAYGINSYEYFFQNKKPDWAEILTHRTAIYSIIVLNNNSGIEPDEIDFFDYKHLLSDLEEVMILRKLNVAKYGVFGILFAKTSKNNTQELQKILSSDLKEYIVSK